jgi:hypothetical protein
MYWVALWGAFGGAGVVVSKVCLGVPGGLGKSTDKGLGKGTHKDLGKGVGKGQGKVRR